MVLCQHRLACILRFLGYLRFALCGLLALALVDHCRLCDHPVDRRTICFWIAVCLIAYAATVVGNDDHAWRNIRRHTMVIAASTAPYVLLRLLFVLNRDPTSSSYIAEHLTNVQKVPLTQFVLGLWQGYRAGWWLLVIPVYTLFQSKRVWGMLATLVLFGTTIMALLIAGDMTRSLMMLTPAFAAALLLVNKPMSSPLRAAFVLTVIACLMLPAEHVIWTFRVPIRYVYAEIDRAQVARYGTFPSSNGTALASRAEEIRGLIVSGRSEEALKRLEALPADALSAETSCLLKVMAWIPQGRVAESEQALAGLSPQQRDSAEALYAEALILMTQKSFGKGVEKVQQAKSVAPRDWLFQVDLRSLEEYLRKPAGT